jgi:exodeoxyribonuclease-1
LNSYYWHDYETWGANPGLDKPSQFAGVRTDLDLNIIDEPLMLYCQPSNDCLPHPQACLITGITPQKALTDGLPEPEFFKNIYSELSQSGTCGVGYNSIRFDDEVTRYGLYRNFYDPYEREWRNGNSRWDIIDMVRLTYALRPETLAWPINEEGIPSFKLEYLSAENKLEHDSAHDALSDVYATIALARLIKEKQPKLYDYACSMRSKDVVKAHINLEERKPLLHISSRFGAKRACAALVVPLMPHPKNKNSVICYDLGVDPQPLLTLSAEEIYERVYSKQEALEEGVERIPLKEVHLNKSPIIATPKLLDDKSAQHCGIDKSVCEQHWHQLRKADLQHKLSKLYSLNPFPPKVDPEQQLYDGFLDNQDKALCAEIRNANPEQLSAYESRLKDRRLQVLLFRYRARFYPETLNDDEQLRWNEWRYQRLTEVDAGAGIVLEDFFEELSALDIGDSHQQAIVDALLEYGDNLLS